MGTSGWRADASHSRHLLLLLAASMSLPTAYGLHSLNCLCDFNTTISCDWDSSLSAQHFNITAATSCKLSNQKKNRNKIFNRFESECDLRPLDPAHPALRACTLVSPPPTREVFHHRDTWIISLVCESVNTGITINYKPADHIKLKPPSRPEVNLTIVYLFSEVPRLSKVGMRFIELQWKKEDHPWEDGTQINQTDLCKPLCQVDLTGLEKGRRYQARSRVRPQETVYRSVWSDWSPVLTWVSPIGTDESTATESEFSMQWEALGTLVVGVVVVLSLTIIICKTDRDTWVYMVKKIRGPPLPNLDNFLCPDGKSQVWLKTGFSIESHHILTGLDAISSVEVTNRWSAPLMQNLKMQNVGAQRSLELKSPDSGVGCSEEEERDSRDGCRDGREEGGGSATDDGSQGSESPEEEGEESQIEKLLSKGVARGDITGQGSLEVCLDYEKVGSLEGQQGRAQSPDSGVGSGGEEQVSEESLEDVDFSLGTKTFTFPPHSDTELRLGSSLIHSSSFFPSFSFSSEDGASMTSTSTLLPSSGGYMLV